MVRRTSPPSRSTRRVQAAIVLVALLLPVMARPAHADDGQKPVATAQGATSFTPPTFADNTVTWVFGPAFRNPFVVSATQPDGADISRHGIEFKHVDAWKYGQNLVEIMINKSSRTEPAAGGGDGVMGLYSIFRFGLGINRLAGRPVVAFGPLRDISLQAGANLETKNSTFAPQQRAFYFGPNLQFRVGQAFLNVGISVRKEWNHNGHAGAVERYRTNANVAPIWHIPFGLGRVRLAFDGTASFSTSKGKDAAGRETVPEFMSRPQLKLDLGPVVGGKPGIAELGIGVEIWRNMYGKNGDTVPGANQFTPLVTLTVHLPVGGSGSH